MEMKSNKYLSLVVSVVCMIGLISCGGGDGSSSGGIVETGTASVALVDSASEDYAAVYITICDIQFHLGGNENSAKSWRSIQESIDFPVTINLLELVNGVRLDLGIVELPAGHHTQLRLITCEDPEEGAINILSQAHPYGNYVIIDKDPNDDIDPVIHKLKVASADKTGFKIVGGYYISAHQTTELFIDFDACLSVVQSGSSDLWHLKPTVKLGEPAEYSIIKGKVTDGTDGIEGVLVTAQQYDATATDEKDKVVVSASTLTDINGDYSLFVEPGLHNIVAFMDGYFPGVNRVEVLAGGVLESVVLNLSSSTASKTVAGSVNIPYDGSELQYATLSFRQEVDLAACPTCVTGDIIEIKTLNVAKGNGSDPDYSVSLPVGNYQLVSSTYGFATMISPIDLDTEPDPFSGDVDFN